VKTLHPGVHGGILAIRDNATHMGALAKHGISTIDLVRSGGLGADGGGRRRCLLPLAICFPLGPGRLAPAPALSPAPQPPLQAPGKPQRPSPTP
jgi:hypothetical protein